MINHAGCTSTLRYYISTSNLHANCKFVINNNINTVSLICFFNFIFSLPANVNSWNDPVRAGRESWRTFHGPRITTNARLIEHMDAMEQRVEEQESKKRFINAKKVEQQERFARQK